MLGIDPDFMCHRLTMDEKVRPIIQRGRKLNEERRLVIKEETQKLLKAGRMREIQYPEWLANIVLVKKENGKWRMCVNFTYQNKACPKDSYPLPNTRFFGGHRFRLPIAELSRHIFGVQLDLHAPS